MKANLLKSILFGAALLSGVVASAQRTLPADVKNYFAVTGYNDEGNPVTVSSTVYEGYGFVVQLPEQAEVNSSKVTLEFGLQNVHSLGNANEIRYHEIELASGANFNGDLKQFLSHAYTMGNVTVPVTVIDGTSKSFTYQIAQTSEDLKIVGTPSSSADAAVAWKMITNNMESLRKPVDDTYIVLKEGAYFQYGDERAIITGDVNLFDNPWTKAEELGEAIANLAVVNGSVLPELANLDNAGTYKPVFYFPAGTALAVGQSIAVLKKNAKITIDLSAILRTNPNARLEKQLSEILRTVATSPSKTKQVILTFFASFNQVLGQISEAGKNGDVNVTVEFTEPEAPETLPAVLDVYLGSNAKQHNWTEEAFRAAQAQYPNAMAVLLSGTPEDYTNILIPQSDATMICKNFVLSDGTVAGTDANTDWYAPMNFTAETGSYARKYVANGYGTACLPFAITSDMINGADILSYVKFDGIETAYFNYGNENEAGVPFIFEGEAGEWNINFNNTLIASDICNENNTYGTYTKTEDYALNYFGVKTSINKFVRLANYLNPFRACLDLNASSSVKQASGARVATSVHSIQNVDRVNTIYSISGAKLEKITKSGLYIVNGKKTFVNASK